MRLFRARRGLKAALAVAGSLLLSAQSAQASHDMQYEVTQTTYVKDQYPNIRGYSYYGSATPKTSVTDLPAGYDLAHKDSATSPITPVPNDEDVVGSGTARARWQPFCAPESDLNTTVRWENTWATPTPSGTVAMVTIEAAGGLFTTNAFIVKQADHDYKIEVPTMPYSSVCSSTTAGSNTLTINGTVSGSSPARRVVQNPATAGTYRFNTSYTDTAGGNHSDFYDVTITN
ncbi:MAG TPA: hypothetical protein VHF47_05320 [Acidimicrobiales bacterium]|nr:hypothetical protein [Acidimicrobiales bacterium]